MEEAPESYKDVNDVVNTCQAAGISKKCIKLRPIGVIKGWKIDLMMIFGNLWSFLLKTINFFYSLLMNIQLTLYDFKCIPVST